MRAASPETFALAVDQPAACSPRIAAAKALAFVAGAVVAVPHDEVPATLVPVHVNLAPSPVRVLRFEIALHVAEKVAHKDLRGARIANIARGVARGDAHAGAHTRRLRPNSRNWPMRTRNTGTAPALARAAGDLVGANSGRLLLLSAAE